VLPDAGFYLETWAGSIECYLEWDRATETQARLAEKLLAYRLAEAELFEEGKPPRGILFVVPALAGSRRSAAPTSTSSTNGRSEPAGIPSTASTDAGRSSQPARAACGPRGTSLRYGSA
jgi:hypothetical protein